MIWLFLNRCCDTTFLTTQLFSRFFFFNTFLSSKALGRDPDHSDQEEVIVSGSDTESDHEESKDSSQERADETTAATLPPNESAQEITEASAPPIDSASQEIELPPLLSDPEKSLPETELIQRDFDQMEAELTQTTADKQTQVSSFAIIC